jgi:large subunit ribosomal protein L25
MTQAATRIELAVVPREVLGKKVKRLRSEGITPANIYGRGIDSMAVQVSTRELAQTIRVAGRNTLLQVHVHGERKVRPVFVHHVQRDPIKDHLLHVDFYQVSLKDKIRIDVPVVIVGEAPAVGVYHGILLQNLNAVTVECLPTDVPPQIEVDVSGLEEIDDAIHLKDLDIDPDVTLLVDPEMVVAKVAPPRIEEVEEVAEEVEEEVAAEEVEEAEAEEEKPEEEAAEE